MRQGWGRGRREGRGWDFVAGVIRKQGAGRGGWMEPERGMVWLEFSKDNPCRKWSTRKSSQPHFGLVVVRGAEQGHADRGVGWIR